MSLDISSILSDWPYEPGQVSARRVNGVDGHDKIQLRLELGLLQMEATGRPDGERPHDHESILEHYEDELKKFREANGAEIGFELDEKGCELLRAEGTMYYHRYLAEFVLEDYPAVIRDTGHNLRLMDFCKAYAIEESDRFILEQYRPYVQMMYARAKGKHLLSDSQPRQAKQEIENGIREIEAFYRNFGQEELVDASGEIAILNAMIKEIELRIPVDPVQKLRRKLAEAIENERYEEAASLRDQLHRATESDVGGPPRL